MNSVKFLKRVQDTIVVILVLTFGGCFLALVNLAVKNHNEYQEHKRHYRVPVGKVPTIS